MTLLANILIDGIAYGMVLFIIAVGLSVTLGLMRFVNLAHGAFAMTGGYIAAWLVREQGLSFYVGVPLAVLATGLLGALLYVGAVMFYTWRFPGAGPAGLECAMVLGKRGYETVQLVDAQPAVGGHLNWVTQLPGFGTWKRVTDWRKTQLSLHTHVGIELNTRLGIDDILNYGAQHVIFATGSSWDTTGMSGPIHDYIRGADASKPEIVTPDQYARDGKPVGKRVVVIDHDAYYMGSAVAIDLAQKGHQVVYLTHNESVGPYLRYTLEEQRVHMKLMELGVKLLPLQFAFSVEGVNVTSVNKWTAEETEIPYDSVLMVTYRKSECALYDQLQAQPERLKEADITSIHLIGDAHTPGMIAQATFSGARLAREFDTEDPDTHQPFIRERRLVGATEDDYQLGARTLSMAMARGK